MIINVRGPNGSGKTTIVRKFLSKHTTVFVDDGLYIKGLELLVVGPYIRNGEWLSTGGCDHFTTERTLSILRGGGYRNYLFESAQASKSFGKWSELALEVGFYNYVFLQLTTDLETCIKNKANRKKEFNRHGESKTTHLVDGFESFNKVQAKLVSDSSYQVYLADIKTSSLIIDQLVAKNNFVSTVLELSGGGKRSRTRSYGLYCMINRPEFIHLEWIRHAVHRLDQFKFDFKEKTLNEFGANIGALSFEAELRGAKTIVGFEYNPERVAFCNSYSHHHRLPCKFYQADFNKAFPSVTAQVSLCCAVDEYIDDVPEFYKRLFESTTQTLLLECNVQRDQDIFDTTKMLYDVGFSTVEFLGTGDGGKIAKKRKLYKCEVL